LPETEPSSAEAESSEQATAPPEVAEPAEIPPVEQAVEPAPSPEAIAEPVALVPAVDETICAGEIVRAVVAHDVQEREPVGTDGPFRADGEPTYVFMQVNNPDGPEKEYTLRWLYSGSDAAPFTQSITAGVSPMWRTWARHRIREGQVGTWTVEIINPDGCVAETVSFEAIGPG
jgi:hypothetical protein